MVRHVANRSAQLSSVFQALGDATRRAVVQRLSNGPASVTELAQPFHMALPSFSQHLDVLEKCGLVQSRKRGRIRTYQLVPRTLRVAEDWMAKHRALWERRLNQLDDYLSDLKEKKR
jgi:DNA-binding transcriptional ArsR family regulator